MDSGCGTAQNVSTQIWSGNQHGKYSVPRVVYMVEFDDFMSQLEHSIKSIIQAGTTSQTQHNPRATHPETHESSVRAAPRQAQPNNLQLQDSPPT